jgi:glycosyltransferase involved in cell wall biosynthesis
VEPEPWLVERNQTIIGYVGVMGRQDGVEYLVRAVSHLVHELGYRDVCAVLIGDGEESERLGSLARDLDIENHIQLPGRLVGDELMRHLSAAHICVDPDPSNPYNDVSSMIKMTEYMALGKPIVAFDLPEHRVTAGGAALYAEPNRPEDLAEQIVTLIENPDLGVAMGEEGRRAVEERLGWEHQSERLIEAYRRTLANDSQPRKVGKRAVRSSEG